MGVFRALRPVALLDSESEIDGAALETLLLQELRAINDYHGLDYKIYFWHSVTGLEVDFVLYGPTGFIAIEVKRKSSILPKDLRGLKAFGKDYPQAKRFVFCGVNQRERQEDVHILPVEYALKNLKTILENRV